MIVKRPQKAESFMCQGHHIPAIDITSPIHWALPSSIPHLLDCPRQDSTYAMHHFTTEVLNYFKRVFCHGHSMQS